MPESGFIGAVQAFNLAQSAFGTGLSFSLTAIAIPVVIEAPQPVLATRQWETMFKKARALVRPWFGTSALACFYLAYIFYEMVDASPWAWKLYFIGGISSLAAFPYTSLVLNVVDKKLLAKMEQYKGWEDSALPEKEAGVASNLNHRLIENWGSLHFLRSLMFAITALTTMVATFFL